MEEHYQAYLKEIIKLIFSGTKEDDLWLDIPKLHLSNEKKYNYSSLYDNNNIIFEDKKSGKFYNRSSCGFIKVKDNNKFNFVELRVSMRLGEYNQINYVNCNSERLCKKGFDKASDFSDGFACVGNIYNGKMLYNYINSSGKPICKEWLDVDFAYDFHNGFAIIEKNKKQNVVNSKGNIICDEWYDRVFDFKDGYAMVEKNHQYNIIGENGKPISKEWFSRIDCENEKKLFGADDYVIVYRQDRFNYLNKNGKLADFNWYQIYEANGKYAFGTKRTMIDNMWYDQIYPFHNGTRLVRIGNKYNYVDKQCKLISKEWFYGEEEFDRCKAYPAEEKLFFNINGLGLAKRPIYTKSPFGKKKVKAVKENYIYLNGKFLDKRWFDKIKYTGGIMYEAVKNDLEYILLDTSKIEIDMKDFKVRRKINGGYKCTNPYKKFSIPYKPIKMYGTNFVICQSDDQFKLFLYDIEKEEKVCFLGLMPNLNGYFYDDNFIITHVRDQIFFMYDDKAIDITDYFEDNLMDKERVYIKRDIKVLSREEFDYLRSDLKNKLLQETKEKNKKLLEEQEKEKFEKELKKSIEDEKKDEEEKNREYLEELEEYKLHLNKVLELRSKLKTINKKKVSTDEIFEVKGDHKEIIDIVKLGLPIIDLSIITFKGVNISGIDFRGTNIKLDPQEVYNKDLRNCDFTGVYLSPIIDFNGSDVRGARFSYDNDSTTIDIMPRFKNAIYDEYTTYNGVSLVEILGPCQNMIKEDDKNHSL